MKIRIQFTGEAEVKGALQRLERAGGDLTWAMRQIAAAMESSTKLRFRDGKDPGGNPWRPLSMATRKNRARRSKSRGRAAVRAALAGNMQPLRDTGRLQASITSSYGPREAMVGTNVTYAPVHQFGTDRAGRGRRTRIPARPFIGLSVADRAEIDDIIREHIERTQRT